MSMEQYEYVPAKEILDKMQQLTREHQHRYEQQLKRQQLQRQRQEMKKSVMEGPKQVPVHVVKVGRNDPCPCGSGQKYKKCCGAARS